MKFGSKKAIFGVIWGGFEGFEPCLGISHPTHPHLGKISQKNVFFIPSLMLIVYENNPMLIVYAQICSFHQTNSSHIAFHFFELRCNYVPPVLSFGLLSLRFPLQYISRHFWSTASVSQGSAKFVDSVEKQARKILHDHLLGIRGNLKQKASSKL